MKTFLRPILSVLSISIPSSHGFVSPSVGSRPSTSISLLKEPIHNDSVVVDDSNRLRSPLEKSITSSLVAASILLGAASSAFAVSGGGLDYAGTNISEQNFSSQNLKGKDFTQVIAKFADFSNSNLQGCRFFGAVLIDSNFEGADARGVSFEKGQMDGANLRNLNAVGGYFSQSLLDVKTLEGGDFTDASIPEKTQMLICAREDTKGTNPMTGVDTRESLMCLD